jgi:GH18 family chitinase
LPEAGSGSGGGDGSTGSSGSSGSSPDAGDDSAGGNGGPDGAADGSGIAIPDTKVVMYLPNWAGSFSSWATKVDFNKMTHLLLAFGTVTGTNGWDLGAQASDVQTLAAAAHAKGVKVLVSIGGSGGDSSIISAYGDPANVAPLVANLDSMVSSMNLDGVDVDVEQGKQMTSSSNYPAFVSQLISTFHPEGKLVTSALAQYIVQDANPDATIIGVVNSFDFINDMIYTTNLSDYTNESNWWTSTINLPKNKLVWGVNFEGNGLSVGTVTQIAMGSKAYGGIMAWEYSQQSEAQLWPAIQSVF